MIHTRTPMHTHGPSAATTHRLLPALAAALAATLALAGCPAHAHGGEHEGPLAAAQHKPQQPWGMAADLAQATRTVEIRMTDDMRFTPATLQVRQGETVRLRVRNDGQLLHELVLGTRRSLDQHADMMLKYPGMEHEEAHMVHVKPGQAGDIVWTFNRAGNVEFACLIAGHYQAGMVGRIQVLAARATPTPQGASR